MDATAFVVTDISYGDAGKGTTVDYLVRQTDSAVVIRHNGGAQAAHNVITPDGVHHTFTQFGSGSFVPGVKTHLSRFMLVNPLSMLEEGSHLQKLVPDIWSRVSVDREALIITPWHRWANRLRELSRGDGRHGSCGVGLGETVRDSLEHPEVDIRVKDITTPGLVQKLERLRDFKLDQLKVEIRPPQTDDELELWANMRHPDVPDWIFQAYRNWENAVAIVGGDYLRQLALQHDTLVFEGAQGVLIDEWFGFHPYTTWSTTTHRNALQLLEEIHFTGDITRLGVMRAYTTRHGPGPFVTEDSSLEAKLKEYHNDTGPWQGVFRYGYLDFVAHQYALEASGGADALVVTGLDRMQDVPDWKVATGYELTDHTSDEREFLQFDNSGMVQRIIPGTIGDRNRRTRLTELVQKCQPHYENWDLSIDEYLQRIGDRLGLPIYAASFGPTAADKRALVAC